MDYKKLAFCLSIVCCLTLVGMGTVLFVMYGNVQAELSGNLAKSGEEVGRLQKVVTNLTGNLAESGEEFGQLQKVVTNLTESRGIHETKMKELEIQNSKTEEQLLETRKALQISLGANDCEDLLNAGFSDDGVYTINNGSSPVQVSCDMTNGGWTIIQKRFDGSTNFRRDFNTYAAGFGDPKSEYWLGLAKIHELTKEGQWALKVDLTAPDDDTAFAEYEIFKVGASPRYQLRIGNYNGNAGDSMAYSNGAAFSTYDKDQDVWSGNCASDVHRNGAWWWSGCGYSNLNAHTYNDGRSHKGMYWYHFKNYYTPMKTSVMKIRKL